MTFDQKTLENKKQSTSTPTHITQAHFDESVIGSGVSELLTRLYLESLDDPREIARRAAQFTSAISEVL